MFGTKKSRSPERQISAVRPMEMVGMDLMEHKVKYALITVDYFSGFITYDPLENATTIAVLKALNHNIRKLGIPESILSDNGPCFKSENCHQFCNELSIRHVTSSPYHHQSNGAAKRAIATIKAILKKAQRDTDITKAIVAYLDTPVNDALPSPAELFYNKGINTL